MRDADEFGAIQLKDNSLLWVGHRVAKNQPSRYGSLAIAACGAELKDASGPCARNRCRLDVQSAHRTQLVDLGEHRNRYRKDCDV